MLYFCEIEHDRFLKISIHDKFFVANKRGDWGTKELLLQLDTYISLHWDLKESQRITHQSNFGQIFFRYIILVQ